MQVLKQQTAATILVGPVLDAAGLPYTGSLPYASFKVTKNGSVGTLNSAATVTHDHQGHYRIGLTASDTDTVGRIALSLNNASYAMAVYRSEVLAAAAFDSLVTNGDLATASAQTSLLNAVNAITTNTARSMPVVPHTMIRPSADSTTYQVMLYLYDLQGNLEDADSLTVTIAARTADNSSRDANLGSTTMVRASAGKYTAAYTVASTHAREAIYFDFTWAISSTAMADSGVATVQDAESLATLAAIRTQTDKLTFDAGNNVLSAADVRKINGGSTSENVAVLKLRSLDIRAGTAENAIYLESPDATVLQLTGGVNSSTICIDQPDDGVGVTIAGGQYGFRISASLAAAVELSSGGDSVIWIGGGKEADTVGVKFDGCTSAYSEDAVDQLSAGVWAAADRSLSGASVALGPTAALSACDIYCTAFKNGTVRLCARVYKDGADIHRTDVSTIVYSIFLLDDQDANARTAVLGHTAVALDAADVLFDTLQSDLQASNYNFRHVPSIVEHSAFTIAGRQYLVEYTITPATGERIIVRFVVRVS